MTRFFIPIFLVVLCACPSAPTPAPKIFAASESQVNQCGADGGQVKRIQNGCADKIQAPMPNTCLPTAGRLDCNANNVTVDTCECPADHCWEGTKCEKILPPTKTCKDFSALTQETDCKGYGKCLYLKYSVGGQSHNECVERLADCNAYNQLPWDKERFAAACAADDLCEVKTDASGAPSCAAKVAPPTSVLISRAVIDNNIGELDAWSSGLLGEAQKKVQSLKTLQISACSSNPLVVCPNQNKLIFAFWDPLQFRSAPSIEAIEATVPPDKTKKVVHLFVQRYRAGQKDSPDTFGEPTEPGVLAKWNVLKAKYGSLETRNCIVDRNTGLPFQGTDPRDKTAFALNYSNRTDVYEDGGVQGCISRMAQLIDEEAAKSP